MFRPNKHHHQGNLFGWQYILNQKQYDLLMKSEGYAFYQEVFCEIDESIFSVLYSDKYSAPNVPVNILVSAILLQQKYNWTEKELIEHLSFDVQTRIALGLPNFDAEAFSIKSYYNFKNRLANYEQTHGVSLLAILFTSLTSKQIKKYGVSTRIQRIDSVQLSTNIQNYTRLSLLAEVLRRLYRSLSKADQAANKELFAPYLKGGQKYVYRLKDTDYDSSLGQLASHYRTLFIVLYEAYHTTPSFQIFERALQDHFNFTYERSQLAHATIEVKPTSELTSDTLQSPDDPDATFRGKNGEKYNGFTATAAETCDPDSPLNLIVCMDTNANNVDDAIILTGMLPDMLVMTPDLAELHTDGAYPCEQVDQIAAENNLDIIQTAVRGAKANVQMDIETKQDDDNIYINCPNEQHPSVIVKTVNNQKDQKSYKAEFSIPICETCPFKEHCPSRKYRNHSKGIATFRFNQQYVNVQKRRTAQSKLPDDRKYLRSGVEATMRSYRRGETNNGKLKYRGLFNIDLYVHAMGIVLNFERIFRYNTALLMIFLRFCYAVALSNTSSQKSKNQNQKLNLILCV